MSLLATLAFAATVAAQAPAPRPTPTPSPSPAATASPEATPTPPSGDPVGQYRVGPGDILAVSVIGHPDLSRTPPVQPNGVVNLPLLGEVPVSGLTALEIQRKLTTLLERDFLVNPQVEVRVQEYQSQFVIVLGEVNSPGRKPLRGTTRLIDLLIGAGGLKPTASGDITITRTEGSFESGRDTLQVTLSTSGLSAQDRVNLELQLRNGDLISVGAKKHVTVEGEVAKPGRYPLESDLTILAAISAAGGFTRFGSNDVKLRRVDPASGKVTVIDVDLDEVRKGKKPDLALQPNDVVTVPRRRF
jgi:polysaccharide export outer membrane protein